ncbi:fibronectin type III domain-containing protein [Paenibacillus sp. GCM10023252]|uniref:GH39 family glycosyl hydrolase n=1 Tax=Paenibacillus sp. GCM10023252 TaxID=3252649 RepID=UPI003613F80A
MLTKSKLRTTFMSKLTSHTQFQSQSQSNPKLQFKSGKRLLPALGAALLSITLAATPITPVQASASPAAVPVQVNWKEEKGKVSDFMYGLNGFQTFNPEVSGSEEYNKKLNYMNPGLLRLHSWEVMNDSSEPNGWIDKANKRWDAAKIKQALEALSPEHPELLLNIPGWPEWMDTDSDGYLDSDKVQDYADFSAELVRIVNVDNDFKVKYWEPTNERDDPYYVHFRNNNEPDRLDELTNIYNVTAKAMKAVDPSIQTGGLAFARGDLYDQVERFVAGTVNEGTLDFLSYHFYASGDLGQSDETIYNRVHNPADPSLNSLAKHTKDIRAIVDEASPKRHIPIWLDEYNVSWSWTNNDPRMSSNKGAVFDALVMIYAQRFGADGGAAWNDYDGVYGKITGEDYKLRPAAHTYQLLNHYFVGETVQAASGDESKLVAYAVRSGKPDKAQSYMIVNRSDDVQLVQTSFKGLKSSKAAIQQHQISAAGYAIGSSTWDAVAQHAIALPAHSVTVWTDSSTVPSLTPPPLVTAEEPPAGSGSGSGGIDEPASNLTGRVADSSSANYSAEGTLDWAVWGTDGASPASAVRKADGGGQISGLTLVGEPSVTAYSPQWWGTHSATWSDGDTIASGDASSAAIVAEGAGKGFSFTVPADETEKQLKVYLGVMGAKGVLTARLSDGSAPDFVTSYEDSSPNVINNSGGAKSRVVTLNFKANSPGQTLTISYVMNYNHWGNALWLQGATLSAPKAALLRGSVAPSGSADLTKEGNLDWTVWGTNTEDPKAAVRKVGVPEQISALATIGSAEYVKAYTADWWGTHSASWSDGTPEAAGTNVPAAIVTGGPKGSGFKLSVPADTTAKTLKLYLGVMGTKGILKARLSDGSAPDFVTSNEDSDPSVINNSGGPASKVVSLTYQAASPGQTLDIEYTLEYNHWGNTLWLQAAALSGADIIPPAAPAGAAIISSTSTAAAISWQAAADNVRVTAYEVYKNGTYVGQTAAPTQTYYIHGLTPEEVASFTVKARDAAGNLSEASQPLLVTASPDTQAPISVQLQGSSAGDGSVKLVWTAAYDNTSVTSYELYDGKKLVTVISSTETQYTVAASHAKKHAELTIVAVDAAGNRSVSSNTVHVKKNGEVK